MIMNILFIVTSQLLWLPEIGISGMSINDVKDEYNTKEKMS